MRLDAMHPGMQNLRAPQRRTCERCGRCEVWIDGGWQIDEDNECRVGSPYCIHEWDITGDFSPVDG